MQSIANPMRLDNEGIPKVVQYIRGGGAEVHVIYFNGMHRTIYRELLWPYGLAAANPPWHRGMEHIEAWFVDAERALERYFFDYILTERL